MSLTEGCCPCTKSLTDHTIEASHDVISWFNDMITQMCDDAGRQEDQLRLSELVSLNTTLKKNSNEHETLSDTQISERGSAVTSYYSNCTQYVEVESGWK